MAIKYFIYSAEQLKLRKEIELKMGRKFMVGHVIVNGVRKPFTELSSNPPSASSRYADAVLVASGDPSTMKYSMPGGVK